MNLLEILKKSKSKRSRTSIVEARSLEFRIVSKRHEDGWKLLFEDVTDNSRLARVTTSEDRP